MTDPDRHQEAPVFHVPQHLSGFVGGTLREFVEAFKSKFVRLVRDEVKGIETPTALKDFLNQFTTPGQIIRASAPITFTDEMLPAVKRAILAQRRTVADEVELFKQKTPNPEMLTS